MTKLSKKDATKLSWSRGVLSWKLHDYQQPLYQALVTALNNKDCAKYVLNCSRRYGKTFILCLIALEFGLRNKDVQIRFAAPTAKALRKIVHPIIRQICKDCPVEFKPIFNKVEGFYKFPSTGSELHLAGTDNGNYESLRGQVSHLNLIDEAGFADELDYTVRSVLMPQTLTTGGKTLLASTPSPTPAHDFYAIAQECMQDGFYSCFTIDNNETIDQETKDKYAKEAGGYESSTYKREYLCQFVVDQNLQIIPEWKDEYAQEVNKDEFYTYYHKYVALDIGVKDLTAGLFGYYDFKNAQLIVEDEFAINGPDLTTLKIKDLIKNTEVRLWQDQKPYRRIADNNNLVLVQDLLHLHQMSFIPTSKDSLDAMVNEVRLMVDAGKVKIHPRCTQLIACLKFGVWNKKKDKFAHSKVYAHFDHLAALIYLIRNLDRNSNPIPRDHAMSFFTHFMPNTGNRHMSDTAQAFQKLFKLKN